MEFYAVNEIFSSSLHTSILYGKLAFNNIDVFISPITRDQFKHKKFDQFGENDIAAFSLHEKTFITLYV